MNEGVTYVLEVRWKLKLKYKNRRLLFSMEILVPLFIKIISFDSKAGKKYFVS